MNYATPQHIIDRYGIVALLLLTDRSQGSIVTEAMLQTAIDGGDMSAYTQAEQDATAAALAITNQALSDASAEIDAYLAAKYDLPLAIVPEVLVRLCVDLVIYRLSADADAGTEERRQRYEDAIKLLVRISKGEVSLGMPDPPPSSNGAVVTSGPGRIFTRDSMKGVR